MSGGLFWRRLTTELMWLRLRFSSVSVFIPTTWSTHPIRFPAKFSTRSSLKCWRFSTRQICGATSHASTHPHIHTADLWSHEPHVHTSTRQICGATTHTSTHPHGRSVEPRTTRPHIHTADLWSHEPHIHTPAHPHGRSSIDGHIPGRRATNCVFFK